jgi:hypothetical protein
MGFSSRIGGILAVSLLTVGCSGSGGANSPPYLAKQIQENPPFTKGLTPYPTHGPYSRRVVRVEIGATRDFAAYEAQLWIKDPPTTWRLMLVATLSLVRSIDKTLYIDGPQGFAAADEAVGAFRNLTRVPGTATLTELVKFSGGFAAANGTGKIFFTEDIGAWAPLGSLPADKYEVLAASGEQLTTIGKTVRKLEIWSSKTRTWRTAGTVPESAGGINQLIWTGSRLILAASKGIYESDPDGRNWTRTDSPEFEILSLAIKDGRLLASTSNGLWSKTPDSPWVRVESPGSLPSVPRVRSSGPRLYACTTGGLQESTDLGEHWSESGNLGVADVRDLASWGQNDYAATARGLFQRSPDSNTWKAVGQPRSITQLEFTDRIWLAVAAEEPVSHKPLAILISTDHGANWSEIAPPPECHTVYRVTSLDGVFFASADAGVFRMEEPGHSWVSAQGHLPRFSGAVVQRYGKQILIGGDNKLFVMQPARHGGEWESLGSNLSAVFPQLMIFDLYAEATSPPLLMAGTAGGLLWRGSGKAFTVAMSPPLISPRFSSAFSIADFPVPNSPSERYRFLGTEAGVWFLADDIPPFEGVLGPWNWAVDFHNRHSHEAWYWIVTSFGGLASAYFLAMTALLSAFWLGSNVFVGRSWLVSLADKPLQVVPRLGRWALFIGYSRRLRAQVPLIREAGQSYFGLTALLPTGVISKPDTTGDILHHHLAAALAGSRAIVLTGKAGAGKTTVLARLAWLALEEKLPKGAGRMLPVFVSAGHYKGNLLQAISDTLRRRDGIPIDDKGQAIRAQLASGGILVLFDGYSEIEGDKAAALEEMLETAADPDFERCRFIFGGRPMDRFPVGVPIFELQPLELDTVENVYLPCFDLSPDQRVKILHQLRVFSSRPIDPLLLTMAVADSLGANPSKTYSALFERYFRRLLKIEQDQNDRWEGWRYCLETFADWFLLSSGSRGVGMPHRSLLDAIAGNGVPAAQSLFTQLKRYYRLAAKDELEIVETLASASLLRSDKNWKFAHDAYEEFFAASRLRSTLATPQPCPISDKWMTRPGELDEVFSYLRELIAEEDRTTIQSSSWPDQWKQAALHSDG